MLKFVPLKLYGIGIQHPEDWQVFINPNNKLSFNEGLIKVDRVTVNKEQAASLSLRWASMKENISIYDYVEELENQFNKKEMRSRKKDLYKINEKVKCTIDGKSAYLLQNEFMANHSIYRVLGRSEKVKVLQMLFFSEETGRMVVASLSTKPEEYKKSERLFKKILFSLHEHNISVKEYTNHEYSSITAL